MSYVNTQILLPLSGANGGTSFPDWSLNNWTVSVNGNTQTSTAQSKFYGSSALFDGTGDYLSVPYNAQLNSLATWTISLWFRLSGGDGSIRNLVNGLNTAGTTGWNLDRDSTNLLRFYFPTGSQLDGSTSVTAGTWHHIYVCRSAGVLYLGMDGAQEDTTTITGTGTANSESTYIGRNRQSTAQDYLGNLQDLRIIVGTALYTGGSYTVPGKLIGTLSNQGVGGEAVKDDTGSAAARTIIAVPRIYGSTFYTAYQTESDGSGNFDLSVPSTTEFSDIDGYSVIALDDSAGTDYNDLVFGRVDAV